jgi:thiol-disulfide isomerase/thioredoxin
MKNSKLLVFIFIIITCMAGFPDISFCGVSAYTLEEIETILDEQIKKNAGEGNKTPQTEKKNGIKTLEGSLKEVRANYWINSPPLRIADLKGKVVVIEFWATWCPICKKSLPHLKELYAKYKSKNFVFMAITDEPAETVEPFIKEMEMPYPIGGGSNSGNDYGVAGIPHALIIEPGREIVWTGHPMDPEFDKILKSLLD